MRLPDIWGYYDYIFSLGPNCVTAVQLKRCGLRKESGPFDWMFTDHTSGLSRVIQNEFDGYMNLQNLRVEGHDYYRMNYLVKDNRYGLVSAHDFDLKLNPDGILLTYPQVIEKIRRRSQRLMERMKSSRRILFVRAATPLQEVIGLEDVLFRKVSGDFRLLIVNYGPKAEIWGDSQLLQRTCMVQFPEGNDIWTGNNEYWDTVLFGVKWSGR